MTDHDWFSQVEGEMESEGIHQRAEELESVPDITPDEDGMILCPVMPLREVIVFPHMVVPFPVGRASSILAIEEAHVNHQVMIAIPQRDPKRQKLRVQDFMSIGVSVAVSQVFSTDAVKNLVVVQGRHRVEIVDYITDGPVLYARARVIEERARPTSEQDAMMRNLMRLFERYAEMSGLIPGEAMEYLLDIAEPGWFADMVANSFSIGLEDRQSLLATLDPGKRLKQVSDLLTRELEIITIEDELHNQVQDEVDRGQRETYLREQMKVIQRELGEADPWSKELHELRGKIKAAKLPKEALKAAMKEYERLFQMPPMSPEVGVIRTYIDWILDLPWTDASEDNLDVNHAAEILEKNHFALEKAKDRILEYIAVKSLQPKRSRQPILCFVGPPGTGKTSLGKSIAEALGRKFVRLSLGGVRDEAEMRGHRRTYIGALPGRILQIMKRAGKINPLFVLDEIDKVGVGYRGDPAAALLEVLDPEMNHEFSDHYLETPYDLSTVMFITTANTRETIPWALLDRMEVIEFPGYIQEEKLEIAKKFLIVRQVEESGLEEGELQFTEQALVKIIQEYTYEAGVRNFEREIGRVCRKIARQKAEGKKYPSRVGAGVIEKYLGPPQFSKTEAEGEDEVGVSTSIAWTSGGGDIMPIEVLLVNGKGTLQLTGQLGEVMQESAQAAMSYLKSRAKQLNVKPDIFETTDVHVHIPEGAIPKDGPSAGITIATAIISAFTGRPVRKDVGMTGEITLRGRVLPIGGVRIKVLAAHRAGLKTVLLPEKNVKDLVDIPKKAKADLEIITVGHMDEVLDIALLPAVKKAAKRKTASPGAKTGEERKPRVQPGA